jgi:hypothetical protein
VDEARSIVLSAIRDLPAGSSIDADLDKPLRGRQWERSTSDCGIDDGYLMKCEAKGADALDWCLHRGALYYGASKGGEPIYIER